MASRTLLFFFVFLTLSSTFSAAMPTVHLINAVTGIAPHFHVSITVGGREKFGRELGPGDDCQIEVDDDRLVYSARAFYGLKIASFKAYDPERDACKENVYLRGDDEGFDISYDQRKWTPVAPWKSHSSYSS